MSELPAEPSPALPDSLVPESQPGADESKNELKNDSSNVASSSQAQPELVEPEVDANFVSQLCDMGFGKNRAIRALHASGSSSLDAAITWLDQHGGDPGVDEPLLVPKPKPQVKLTPEEAKARALELQAAAKAKREKEEREMEKLREKERIRMGKELNEVARIEADQKLKRLADERKRDKEEEARAKEKIRLKLEEDRRVRRRKLGLPEELTDEEKAEEERRKAERAAVQSAHKLVVKPVSRITAMRDILTTMKQSSTDQAKFLVCCKTLNAYCRNVYTNISDASKRTIKLENKALQERVVSMPGGLDFLKQVGFEVHDADGVLVLPAGDQTYEKAVLQGAAEVLDSAINNPMFGLL